MDAATYWQADIEVDGVEAARRDVHALETFMFDLVDALAAHGACVSAGRGRVGATMTVVAETIADAARVTAETFTAALDGEGEIVRLTILSDAEAYG